MKYSFPGFSYKFVTYCSHFVKAKKVFPTLKCTKNNKDAPPNYLVKKTVPRTHAAKRHCGDSTNGDTTRRCQIIYFNYISNALCTKTKC